jgi:hypothetical protein
VLKKLGIVAAAATASMIALSPLAFAGEKHDDGRSRSSFSWEQESQSNECHLYPRPPAATVPITIDAPLLANQHVTCINADDSTVRNSDRPSLQEGVE